METTDHVLTISKFAALFERRRLFEGAARKDLDDKSVLFYEDVISILDEMRKQFLATDDQQQKVRASMEHMDPNTPSEHIRLTGKFNWAIFRESLWWTSNTDLMHI